MFDELAAAGVAVDSCKDAWVGGGIDDPVGVGQFLQIAGRAQVGMIQAHAEPLELRPVCLASRADEVVEADHLPTGSAF